MFLLVENGASNLRWGSAPASGYTPTREGRASALPRLSGLLPTVAIPTPTPLLWGAPLLLCPSVSRAHPGPPSPLVPMFSLTCIQ